MVWSGGGFGLIYSHSTGTQQPIAASPGSPIARSNLTQAIEAATDPFTQKVHIDRATVSDLGRETQTLRVSLPNPLQERMVGHQPLCYLVKPCPTEHLLNRQICAEERERISLS